MKPLNWLALLLALCLFASFAVVACGDDDDDDDDNDDSGGDDDDDWAPYPQCDDTWTDSSTGLTWQVCPPPDIWRLSGTECSDGECCDFSKNYCEDLVFGGYDDWRLANIDELRTLIRGCASSEPSGDCDPSDSDFHSCDGCGSGAGGHDGCYIEPSLRWCEDYLTSAYFYAPFFLSYSESDQVGYQVDFAYAGIKEGCGDSDERIACVRP